MLDSEWYERRAGRDFPDHSYIDPLLDESLKKGNIDNIKDINI